MLGINPSACPVDLWVRGQVEIKAIQHRCYGTGEPGGVEQWARQPCV